MMLRLMLHMEPKWVNPIIFNMGLTHLGSVASIFYKLQLNYINEAYYYLFIICNIWFIGLSEDSNRFLNCNIKGDNVFKRYIYTNSCY